MDAARQQAGSSARHAGLPTEPDYPNAVHPLQRYAAARAAPEPDYRRDAAPYADEPDPSRYDDALYGQLDDGAQHPRTMPAYADDAYAYQDGYDDGAERASPETSRRHGHRRRRSCAGGRRNRAPRLPIAPMSDRPAAASRRSSGLTPVRPRSCRRPSDGNSQGAGPHGGRRRRRENRSPRRSAGRRQRQGPVRAWCFRR